MVLNGAKRNCCDGDSNSTFMRDIESGMERKFAASQNTNTFHTVHINHAVWFIPENIKTCLYTIKFNEMYTNACHYPIVMENQHLTKRMTKKKLNNNNNNIVESLNV